MFLTLLDGLVDHQMTVWIRSSPNPKWPLPYLFDPSDLLLPALLLAQLGDGAYASHGSHGGVAGLSPVVSLLPGRQDVGTNGNLFARGDGGLDRPDGGD